MPISDQQKKPQGKVPSRSFKRKLELPNRSMTYLEMGTA